MSSRARPLAPPEAGVVMSPTEWIVVVALACIVASIGYRLADRDRELLGRAPWGISPEFWGLFWVAGLVGAVLFPFAHLATVRHARRQGAREVPVDVGEPVPGRSQLFRDQSGLAPPISVGPVSPTGLTGREHGLEAGRPVREWPDNRRAPLPIPDLGVTSQNVLGALDVLDAFPAAVVTTRRPDPSLSKGLEPGWKPDPGGRFHYRWWSRDGWTHHVAIDGVHLVDTNPDQRLGRPG